MLNESLSHNKAATTSTCCRKLNKSLYNFWNVRNTCNFLGRCVSAEAERTGQLKRQLESTLRQIRSVRLLTEDYNYYNDSQSRGRVCDWRKRLQISKKFVPF
ncbi:uncharacterized protein LOC143551397 [Bidens hawaiensis]|uniref:uncharacterized protein LOC143551397 n=1 Tax=Bidens hawaiensis TaxID=980011 RepID=UPI004048F820